MLQRPEPKAHSRGEQGVMRISQWAHGVAQVGLGALVASVLSTPVWAAGPESQPAVWTEKELHFVYTGFTTHYSCEGLRDQIRKILLELGARKEDLKVRESGCTRLSGGPEPFPGVEVKLHVLTPAAGPASQPVVPAHWKPVDLLAHERGLDAAGQCELYEEVKHSIVPLFTVRNLEFASSCVPHQISPGSQRLVAEVLVPDSLVPPPGSP
jgi:hypothetical protein